MDANQPHTTVSVIMPVFNTPQRFLEQALLSVCAQTFKDWLLYVIDDGSTNDLSWISQQFPQVIVIRQSHSGVPTARNHGIAVSKSEFIAFIDSDDIWAPEKLEIQIAALKKDSSIDLCYTDFKFIDLNGKSLPDLDFSAQTGALTTVSCGSLAESIRFNASNTILTSTVVLRRQCFNNCEPFDPDSQPHEDTDLWFRLGATSTFARLHSALVEYRLNPAGLNLNYRVTHNTTRALRKKYANLAEATKDEDLKRSLLALARSNRYAQISRAVTRFEYAIKEKHWLQALEHALFAFSFGPLTASRRLLDSVRMLNQHNCET